MIEKLTEEQTQALPVYRDRGLEAGLRPKPVSKERATEVIAKFFELVLGQPVPPVFVASDPLQAWRMVSLLIADGHTQTVQRLVDDPNDTEAAEALAQLKCEPFSWPFLSGHYDSALFSFFDYMHEVLGALDSTPELLAKYKAWRDTRELGPIWVLDEAVVVCVPVQVTHLEDGRLHCTTGAAVEYPSGWKVHALNGVRVPEYLVVTPEEELDINWWKSQTNADVAAEFVRKYGVERMLDLGTKVDSYEKYLDTPGPTAEWIVRSEYELWDMHSIFQGVAYQPYLKMKNQTTGIWHVEAVSPDCRTITDALKERFSEEEFEIVKIS